MRVKPHASVTTPVIATKIIRKAKPPQHWLEKDPPPPIKLLTCDQIEEANPGLKGRLRAMICRADALDPDYHWLRLCIVRVGRALYIDELKFRDELHQRICMPPAPSRNSAPQAAA